MYEARLLYLLSESIYFPSSIERAFTPSRIYDDNECVPCCLSVAGSRLSFEMVSPQQLLYWNSNDEKLPCRAHSATALSEFTPWVFLLSHSGFDSSVGWWTGFSNFPGIVAAFCGNARATLDSIIYGLCVCARRVKIHINFIKLLSSVNATRMLGRDYV